MIVFVSKISLKCEILLNPEYSMTIFLLRYLPSEQQHGIPGHLSVVEDKATDPGKGFGTPWLEGHSCQRVGAQVQERQVRDVGYNFTDLKITKIVMCVFTFCDCLSINVCLSTLYILQMQS